MHHRELKGKIFACPVKELAIRAAYIKVHTSDVTKILYAYWDSAGRGNVTDRDMSFHMKFVAAK